MAGGKGLRLSPEDLAAIAKRPGYRVRGIDTAKTEPVAQICAKTSTDGSKESKLEIRFAHQLAVDGMPPYIRNYLAMVPNRDLELDFAWPQWKVGVEIQGGAHRASVKLLDRDCEKICLGLLAGWTILPLGPDLVKSGRGFELLQAVLAKRRAKHG